MRHQYYQCGIIAKKPGQLEQIANHLRYWPYVKYYCFIDDRSIMVGMRLGETRNHRERVHLYKRSRQLILLCLRQYDVEITPWHLDPKGFIPTYSEDLFVRPTATVRPFSTFIEELDRNAMKPFKGPDSPLNYSTTTHHHSKPFKTT